MKRHTILTASSIALISATVLSACSTASTGGGTATNASTSAPKIGGVVPTASDPFFVTLMCGATQQAKAEGASMDWKPTTNTSTAQLQSNLNAVSLNDKAGIIISGTGDSSFNAKVQSLQQGGTPVAVVNAPILPAVEYASFLSTTDNTAFANYVANDIGHSGSVGILGGIPGIPALATRYTPMVADLKKVAPTITVLPVQYDNLDPTTAASNTSALIAAHPDLKAIYAISGPEGTGAATAIAQAGKTGKIKIYTYDATPEIVQDLQQGTIRAALAQSPYEMGADAVKAILAHAKAQKSNQPVTADSSISKTVALKILTKSNVNDPSSKPFEYQSTCN
jgi:ABC-type sugar transport system substrate-binding protein